MLKEWQQSQFFEKAVFNGCQTKVPKSLTMRRRITLKYCLKHWMYFASKRKDRSDSTTQLDIKEENCHLSTRHLQKLKAINQTLHI